MTDATIKTEFDSLRADFAQLRTDLASLSKAIGERTAQGATESLIDLQQVGKTVKRRLHKAAEDADSLRKSGVTAIEQQINERPLAVLALAFGIGLLIGKMAHRS
jgi:ElaB/YqjD/DUF883 family membrane-anchored ribosome-binding protein